MARRVQENEERGTDSMTVVEEALNYIVRSLRNPGGKIVARSAQENDDTWKDAEPVFEKALNYIVQRLRNRGGNQVARRCEKRRKWH